MRIISSIVVGVVLGMVGFISCKKELSCENCLFRPQPPVASAGTDQIIVLPEDSAVLDGSGSSDPDNDIISYVWEKVSGPATFTFDSIRVMKFTVRGLSKGSYQFALKVTDQTGLFSRDTVLIQVQENNISAACNISLVPVTRLPAAGGVSHAVSNGRKILFTRYDGGVDVYDTVARNWSTVNKNQHAIYSKGVSAGNKVLYAAPVIVSPIERNQMVSIFDTEKNRWSSLKFKKARFDYASAVVGHRLFYAGGITDSSGQSVVVRTIDVYDAVKDEWSQVEFPGAREGMVAAGYGSRIYFAGGQYLKNDSLVWSCDTGGNLCDSVPARIFSDRVDIWDLQTNTWSVTHLSEGRTVRDVLVVQDKIFFSGGKKENGYSTRLDIYHVPSNTWQKTDQTLTEPGTGFYNAGNKILVTTAGDKINILDSRSMGWSIKQMPFPHQKELFESGLVASLGNKLVFFLQYIQSDDHSREIDVYDSETDQWCHTRLDFDLKRTSILRAGNRVYVAGGTTNTNNCCSYEQRLDAVWWLSF